jgi:hypothetical protein
VRVVEASATEKSIFFVMFMISTFLFCARPGDGVL